jgi:hypothetical protein
MDLINGSGQNQTSILEKTIGPTSKTSSADLARYFLEETPINYTKARRLYHECELTYPQDFEVLFSNLIKEYNSVCELELIKAVQKRIAVSIDDAATSIKIAREINYAINQIRVKDRVATQLILLQRLFDESLQKVAEHHDRKTATEGLERELLTRLVKADGDICNWSNADQAELARVLDCTLFEVEPMARAYWTAAQASK